MDPFGTFCRLFYQPILYRKWGLPVSVWKKKIKCIESMSAESLLSYQHNNLVDLLIYSYNNVPYYKNIFKSIGIDRVEDITIHLFDYLPVLTKDKIRKNGSDLRSRDNTLKFVFQNMTGGSTGTPLIFFQDAQYRAAALGTEQCILNWWGVLTGDRSTSFWGADREIKDLSLRDRCMMWCNRENMFDSFSMSEEKMHEFAKKLVKWKPKYIKGYASSLHFFARFLLDNKKYRINPLAIRSTAETLFNVQRKEIEKAFSCKVYNFYGSREVNNIATECLQQNGLHILSGTRIVEVVDENNKPVPCGRIGKIVVTDLVNRAMPFIRYENGDLGIMSDKTPCKCGLPYPRLKEVVGRVSDILVGDNGQYVHGEFITHLFYGLSDIESFKVLQQDQRNIEVYIKLVPNGTLPDLTFLCKKMRERLGDVSIQVSTIDSFERNSSGKHQFIISKISPFQIRA